MADDVARGRFSQHAQVLALLTDVLGPKQRQTCWDGLIGASDLSQTQPMYWMFYLFDTFYKMGHGDLLLPHLGIWRGLADSGLKTPPEMFEPTRSDCHGWGSHPLFHLQATVAGVRPAAPGFAKVDIAPAPGSLRRIRSRLPHPRGYVEMEIDFTGGRCRGKIELPEGISGVFRWRGQSMELRAGRQDVQVG